MFDFRNIDAFIPHKFEKVGMLQGKRWYINPNKEESNFLNSQSRLGLFKPKRKERGDSKVFCANHYGEFMGYLLALNSEVPACKVELAHLSEYYESIHKMRHHATPEEKYGCISYSKLGKEQVLEPGEIIIDRFKIGNKEKYLEIIKNDKTYGAHNDNIEVILAAIEFNTREYYTKVSEGVLQDDIETKVKENRRRAIEMMVYDCVNGNNDRHDENWSMVTDISGNDFSLYPMYDNERVLGLYENQNTIEKAISDDNIETSSEEILFSRMRVPGEQNRNSNYKDVLKYLLENYQMETELALNKILSSNSPMIVENFLNSCKGLPKSYKEFGTETYKSRYNFAKELYQNKNINNKITLPEHEER